MTTKIIDCALSASAFPSNYTGPGTLIGNVLSSVASLNQFTTGNFTSTGDAVEIRCGFVPRDIEIYNETDAVLWKKKAGMAAANAIKIDTAVATDANGYITVNATADGGANVTLSATLVGNSKSISFSLRD